MFFQSGHLKKQHAKANKRLKKAISALAPIHKGGEMEEFMAAQKNVLHYERELAKNKSESYAIHFDFPVKWDVGSPSPYLLSNEDKTFLSFYISNPAPNWYETCVNITEPPSSESALLCLVKFECCMSAKLGHPGNAMHNAHYLYGRGLESYSAQIVMNSKWIDEVSKNHGIDSYDNPGNSQKIKHYIFWFHDCTFECLAESYEVEVTSEKMGDLLSRMQDKLLE